MERTEGGVSMNSDLISRSALLEEVTRGFDAFVHGAYFRAACDAIRAKRAVICMLNDAPAVDAEVVRHGKWIAENIRKKSYLRQCSVCNKIAYFCGTGCSYNYCPNCGAKMEDRDN